MSACARVCAVPIVHPSPPVMAQSRHNQVFVSIGTQDTAVVGMPFFCAGGFHNLADDAAILRFLMAVIPFAHARMGPIIVAGPVTPIMQEGREGFIGKIVSAHSTNMGGIPRLGARGRHHGVNK